MAISDYNLRIGDLKGAEEAARTALQLAERGAIKQTFYLRERIDNIRFIRDRMSHYEQQYLWLLIPGRRPFLFLCFPFHHSPHVLPAPHLRCHADTEEAVRHKKARLHMSHKLLASPEPTRPDSALHALIVTTSRPPQLESPLPEEEQGEAEES